MIDQRGPVVTSASERIKSESDRLILNGENPQSRQLAVSAVLKPLPRVVFIFKSCPVVNICNLFNSFPLVVFHRIWLSFDQPFYPQRKTLVASSSILGGRSEISSRQNLLCLSTRKIQNNNVFQVLYNVPSLPLSWTKSGDLSLRSVNQ